MKLLAAGLVPHEVIPHLCGAFLLAVKKKGAGHRPIAVGEVLRRLTSKCLSTAVRAEVIHILTPLQVGVGVRGGCEAIIHSVARTLEREDLAPGSFFLIFPMHSIALVGNVCSRRLDPAFLHYLGGLRAAMEHSLYSTLAAIEFLVVVESNKGTLCALLSRSSLLLRN